MARPYVFGSISPWVSTHPRARVSATIDRSSGRGGRLASRATPAAPRSIGYLLPSWKES
ncbi:hypothetical protein [Streptomyces sp. NPDC005077]|uniref:hypothetical protein n=1 Tax=Streptomyces sp. NPDC005077 TaxID=3154292 RepID=UPI0033BC89D0